MESSRRGADNAALGVAAALDVGDGDVLYRTVALDGTGDACDLWVHVGVGIGLIEGVVFAADEGVVDVAVGCYGGGASEGSGEVLHGECIFGIRSSLCESCLKSSLPETCKTWTCRLELSVIYQSRDGLVDKQNAACDPLQCLMDLKVAQLRNKLDIPRY
jgi:hypothetical protein